MARLLHRYDEPDLLRLFDEEGILRSLARRGFGRFRIAIEQPAAGLPHTRLFACKQGGEFMLLDGVLLETSVSSERFHERGFGIEKSAELTLVYWFREEDPTARFDPQKPALPLQEHPGLGTLRRVFRVVARMSEETGKDGVACVPKLFHDAAIFFRSRLFLFLDPREQGRFERALADLKDMPLRAASVGFAAGLVRDAAGARIAWTPGLQVFPILPMLTNYFHSDWYAREHRAAFESGSFACDSAAVERAVAALRAAGAEPAAIVRAPPGATSDPRR